MIEGAVGLMALHHGDGFTAKCAAQPFEFANKVGNVRSSIGKNQGLEGIGVGQRIFDAEPSTPRMPQQMHLAEAKGRADDLDLLDIALQCPKTVVVWSVRGATAE